MTFELTPAKRAVHALVVVVDLIVGDHRIPERPGRHADILNHRARTSIQKVELSRRRGTPSQNE